MCQTSTTLYNAVRLAGLEIVERRIHSIAPSYIKHGMDAAVAWPYTDFKFRNDSASPVIVKAEVQKWRVRVWILGKEGVSEMAFSDDVRQELARVIPSARCCRVSELSAFMI